MRKFFLFALCCFVFENVCSKDLPILLPKPVNVKWYSGNFVAKGVQINSKSCEAAGYFENFLEEFNGVNTKVSADYVFKFDFVDTIDNLNLNTNEAYILEVTKKEVSIKAITLEGFYRAIQTLRQLTNKTKKGISIKCCKIVDYPAFRIRGFMQDVGRSYISVEELKREIDILSKYKINTFHFHLTENQAWRLESKIFPQLNDSVNTTRMKGKFYTHREVKELSEYCRERFITLIPEIDMPGHSAAFVRAFGCDMQSEKGVKILKKLIDEVCEVFENEEYLHIGTDEVKFTNPTFVPDMVKYVRAKGKKVISWNPGWNYKPGEIDMTQLWSYRGKAQKGIPAIDCRFHYINHFDSFGDIFSLYNSRIYDVPQGSDDIAGTIVAVWNDRLLKSEENIVLENSFYPCMLAIAERAWLGGGYEYFNKDGVILSAEDTPQFKEFADFEKRMLWHKDNYFNGYPFPYVKQTNVKWKITDQFPNGGDLLKSFPPEEEIQEVYNFEGKIYSAKQVTGAGIYLRHVWGKIVPAFYKEPKENHTAYAYTYVFSPKKQEVGAFIEFQNYSRSEMDLPPQQGKWDYKGSRIWINDNEILPPIWEATHTEKSNEIPMGNENFSARKPIKVTLNKGWNKVFIKLPVGKFSAYHTRLVKWMFTTIFVTPDGKKAIENIIYSPDKIK